MRSEGNNLILVEGGEITRQDPGDAGVCVCIRSDAKELQSWRSPLPTISSSPLFSSSFSSLINPSSPPFSLSSSSIMTAVLSPSSYYPGPSILLNRSPSASPYYHPSSLPPLVPSGYSSSSSSPSPNLNGEQNYIVGSPASPKSRSASFNTQMQDHPAKPRPGSAPNSYRIRFAPLPDPRRDAFASLQSEEDLDLPSVFLEDTDSSKQSATSYARKATRKSSNAQDAKPKPATPGSLLFAGDPGTPTQASALTPTPAGAAAITPRPVPKAASICAKATPDLDDAGWALPHASPCPSSISLPEERSTRPNSIKSSKWSRRLMKPLSSSSPGESDQWGFPLLKKVSSVVTAKEVDLEIEKRKAGKPRSRSTSGLKLLNGRVYGAKRAAAANLFASARSEEPQFVEWGYGGMGSVQAANVGSGIWSKLQAGQGVSIGAHDAESSFGRRSVAPSRDDDDGSGMAWVKRRREQRERAQKEKESTQAVNEGTESLPKVLAKAETPLEVDPDSSVCDPDPPCTDKTDGASGRVVSPSPISPPISLPTSAATTPGSEDHVLMAAYIPPRAHHHHSGSHGHALLHTPGVMERVPSGLRGREVRQNSADTMQVAPGALEILQTEDVIDTSKDDALRKADSLASALSDASSSTLSEDSDEEADADEDEPYSSQDNDDVDEDEQECKRITAMGAGVEKISRHKETAPAQGE
ncbi:uncharacterized protein FIBRA_08028 [Fibroporia radiculosa]|uniref:Uncharacterized protein n=1 Tax=Fibroporia radiculosa TaxID=599839 RepID=J4GW24_9APHY|nr:uncharacterized protein FIBRA_08028 [Fibroporia radiculosa]CCM05795.1 predicted protein [Fibroporia radiculosa]